MSEKPLDLGWIIRSLEVVAKPLGPNETGLARLEGLRTFIESLKAARGPVEPVPAPVGLDLEAALETERQRAEDDLEGARATGLSNAEQVSRARMMAYAHALTLARRAALVHPPKATPPQPQAQPSEAHACPFCKHTLKSRDGFYTCSNRACSFPLGIAPTPTAGAPTPAAAEEPAIDAGQKRINLSAYAIHGDYKTCSKCGKTSDPLARHVCAAEGPAGGAQ